MLEELLRVPELSRRSTKELERFLYFWDDPRKARRIVKIAPGEDARYWADCLQGGYICVGWDDLGDLREFESKSAFREAFAARYSADYNQHRAQVSKKANELWTLRELEPGDMVVANKGISRVLAIGEVVEPAYEWRPERPEYKHTVRVKWDTEVEKEIPPQKGWAFVTVAKVPADLYAKITVGPVVDLQLTEIESALRQKGQVVLYGPPGTGKTYWARRFAVWWLLSQSGAADAERVLADPAAFSRAQAELAAGRVVRRVWWAVANPKEWSWDRLFAEGKVEYRYGRLRRNYPLVQPDDLVVGYQSTPDKRIVALAKVARGLGVHGGSEPTIELTAITPIANGLTYEELSADPLLAGCEAMRHHNQGTLFRLSEEEALHLLELLGERDPKVVPHAAAAEAGASRLTWLTFHPSYSYEDFVEGFRPSDDAGPQLRLRLEDGIFKRVCRQAQAQPAQSFLIVIDEINRAHVSKVFGELITLIERDKRGLMVTLPQSKESFCVPPNVFILGTMNTADRSIKLLDAAFRRRFAFIEVLPDSEVLQGAKVGDLPLDELLETLNERIASFAGREKQIGHSYLMQDGRPIAEVEELARRFRQEILPLLQEYCYDDYANLARLVGKDLIDEANQTINRDVLDDPLQLTASLAALLGGSG